MFNRFNALGFLNYGESGTGVAGRLLRRALWVGTAVGAGCFALLLWSLATHTNPAASFMGLGWVKKVTHLGESIEARFTPASQVYKQSDAFATQHAAQEAYARALAAKSRGDWQVAQKKFALLRKSYPGLRSWLALHEAEAAREIPREDLGQLALMDALEHHPPQGLMPVLLYRLGQSALRSSQNALAEETFDRLVKEYPASDYGMGARYYLGELLIASERAEASQKGADAWWYYLEHSPGGRFSPEIAARLNAQMNAKSAQAGHDTIALAVRNYSSKQFGLLGRVMMLDDLSQCASALPLLEKSDKAIFWPDLAVCRAASALPSVQKQAVPTLQFGLKTLIAKNTQEVQASQASLNALAELPNWPKPLIENVIRLVRSPNVRAALSSKASVNLPGQVPIAYSALPQGLGDALVWQDAQALDGDARRVKLAALAKRYPQSPFAPESLWESALRPTIVQAQWSAYQSAAEAFLEQYPTARRAPDVALWQAHALRKQGSLSAARSAYESVLARYPLGFAGYRASQWLEAIGQGEPVAPWPVQGVLLNKIPPRLALKKLPAEAWMPKGLPVSVENALKELQAIGAWDDIALWAEAHYEQLQTAQMTTTSQPSANANEAEAAERSQVLLIQALNALQHEVYDTGMRTLREALQTRTDQAAALHALLYPLPQTFSLDDVAQRAGVPVTLAYGLTREESYFNPQALSGSGARGLMQLMPATASEVAGQAGVQGFTLDDLYDPKINTQLGTRYLGGLIRQFEASYGALGVMLATGAYNGGPGAMSRWINADKATLASDPDWFMERIPVEQSREYIRKVLGSAWAYGQLYGQKSQTKPR
ncbi:MAG: transglycosylase SLT domain-containing protein [Vampirovibrionales bacterium]|nr:transglycosylase SLT domain-containing protein [Vampirovibrionales bacterium]